MSKQARSLVHSRKFQLSFNGVPLYTSIMKSTMKHNLKIAHCTGNSNVQQYFHTEFVDMLITSYYTIFMYLSLTIHHL
jgi:hypothetical protein